MDQYDFEFQTISLSAASCLQDNFFMYTKLVIKSSTTFEYNEQFMEASSRRFIDFPIAVSILDQLDTGTLSFH